MPLLLGVLPSLTEEEAPDGADGIKRLVRGGALAGEQHNGDELQQEALLCR